MFLGLCRAALGTVVRLLTTNMEEIGCVLAAGMTVFGIAACNREGAIDALPQKTITSWGQYKFQ